MITFCNIIVIDFNYIRANISVYRQDCLTICLRRFTMNLLEGIGFAKEGWDD